MKHFSTVAAICSLATLASAETFQQAQTVTQAELRASTEELSALYAQIESERLPMARELDDLQSQVIALREEARTMRGQVDVGDTSVLNLQKSVDTLKDNINYMINLLGDYTLRYETLTGLSERPRVSPSVQAASLAKENNNMSAGERLEAQLGVVESALERLNDIIGGYTFEGHAITMGNNQEVPGTFLVMGPATFFSPSDAAIPSGITSEGPGSIRPVINVLKDPKASDQFRSLIANGSGIASYGPQQAFLVENESQSFVEEFIVGGMVMPFIDGLALAAFIVAIIKWISLAGVRAARTKDVDAILDLIAHNDIDGATAHANKIGGPVGDMLAAAIKNCNQDREVIEEVLYEKIISAQPKMDRWLPFIAVVAATAPLLGLLGTVTGMIKTFKLITIVGSGDARALSSGISEALITTKYGLVSAIPALIIHAMLSRKARSIISSMEQTAVSFINGIVELRNSADKANIA
jgi:biopolymer transport protein ExbB